MSVVGYIIVIYPTTYSYLDTPFPRNLQVVYEAVTHYSRIVYSRWDRKERKKKEKRKKNKKKIGSSTAPLLATYISRFPCVHIRTYQKYSVCPYQRVWQAVWLLIPYPVPSSRTPPGRTAIVLAFGLVVPVKTEAPKKSQVRLHMFPLGSDFFQKKSYQVGTYVVVRTKEGPSQVTEWREEQLLLLLLLQTTLF